MKQQEANSLKSSIILSQFGDQEQEFDLQERTDWLQSVLSELKTEMGTEATFEKNDNIQVKLKIKRLHNSLYGEHLIVRTSYKADYLASCVRCLKPTDQKLKGAIAACFLNSHFEENEEYSELTEIFVDNEEMDLCFHKKGKVDLAEFIREQFMIDMNPFPLHATHCKGLCQTCGEDKNEVDCTH